MDTAKEWDADLDYIGSRDHVHAVGAFALYYNTLEMALYGLLQRYLKGSIEAHSYMHSSLNNRQKVDFIKLMATHREDADGADAVHHAMKCFDICAENRNLLLHAIPKLAEGVGADLVLMKETARKPGYLTTYDFSLDQIRGAAIAADETETYVFRLMRILEERMGHNPFGETPLPALPQPPLQPRKLSLSRRDPTPEAD